MYINKITIQNIRSIQSFYWSIWTSKCAGWHVIIGDNGSGKSTLLRSIALALVGPTEAVALRQNWNDWLTKKRARGYIELSLSDDKKFDKFSGRGRRIENYFLPVRLTLQQKENDVILQYPKINNFDPMRFVWGGKSGWFSAGFGPFRRFRGGDKDYDKLFYSNPKLAAHLSLFGEDVALTECLQWLQDLQFKKLEGDPEGNLIDSVKEFVNQSEFLPHQARLEHVSSKGVEFVDGNGCRLPVEELSDGYRSILSLTFELIRQLTRVYGYESIFDSNDKTKIIPPGVVLIDEIDAHLHPTWQRRVGIWFREHFPNLQFIVTTHSPLICQAATVGTVWRLPKPGSNESGGMVTGKDLDRLLYGNVLDAYGTEAFGADVTRSDESKKRLKRLAELNRKELCEQLSEDERNEQKKLRAMMPTSPHKVC
ncbi:MAG: AAA family ATPase [Coleofasciculus sp. A1-SPW-01]|uniref:AAA family ATPase n=1 Tax=Coleofasciculus sp. A1-SPW-01 TaxID=3070819 RepID=UPI0032F3A2F3